LEDYLDKQRKANLNERRKRQLVQNWISSFVVTSVVVVVAVISPTTASASANILSLESVGTNVYYQVEVLDEGNTLDESSLKIIAESNIESVEESLKIGEDCGVFYDLRPNTQYTISVMGSSGFGEYILTEQTIQTKTKYITPASADLNRLESIGTDIYYSVIMLDDDKTLIDVSIKIIAYDGITNIIQELIIGQNEGVFENLTENTIYNVKVVAVDSINRECIFAEHTIETTRDYSGQFISADFVVDDNNPEMFTFEGGLSYIDYKSEIKDIYIDYSYFMNSQGEEEEPYEIEFENILVTNSQFTFIILDIPKVSGYLNIKLIVILTDDTAIVLDEKTVNSPLIINAYAYVNYVGETFIEAVVYPDMYILDASYYAIIKSGDVIIDQKDITIELYQESYLVGNIVFDNLIPLSEYVIEFYIRYVDSNTLVLTNLLFDTVNVLTEQFMAY
jgi:hypothetical protein